MLCGFAFCVQSQQSLKLRKTIIAAELGFHGAGFAVEWNATGLFTVETSAVAGPSYDLYESNWFSSLNIPYYSKPAARFSLNPRFYVSRHLDRANGNTRRIEQYIGANFTYVTATFKPFYDPTTLLHIHYGVRQQASARLLFTAYGGIGKAQNTKTGYGTAYPVINVKFGFIIN